MLRSAAAIVVGFVLIGLLAVSSDLALMRAFPAHFDAAGGTRNAALLLTTLGYVTAYATFGCWLTARLAPSRPMFHALVLGALGLAFNVVGSAMKWDTAPLWYHVVGLGLTLPAAWLGGWLRERQLARVGGARRLATA
jgi:hypothetical protein